MRILISRLQEYHHGWDLSLDDGDSIKRIALLNGNKPSEDLISPAVVFSLDPHVIYGVSHPTVISQILTRGPQPLVTTKEIAHKMYEHGMKASWWRVKHGSNSFFTNLETFYEVVQDTKHLSLITGVNETCGCLVRVAGYAPALICQRGFSPKDKTQSFHGIAWPDYTPIVLDDIATSVSCNLKPGN